MKYYEADFTIEPDSENARDIVSALAGEAGFESFDANGDVLKGYIQVEDFDEAKLDDALKNFPFENVKVSYEYAETADEDWNASWEEGGFEPIVVDDKCVIYAAKDTDKVLSDPTLPSLKVAIDARQAFGTGTHETTRLMISNLLNMDLMGKHVLDCGCGTGILGIVAKKLGAAEVVGYDIDDWSVRNAQHNAELNGVEIDVFEGDKGVLSHVSGVFDVVLANINRNILLSDMPAFHDVVGGGSLLILSGFYVSDIPSLLEKAKELDMKELSRKTEGEWACIVLGE